MTQEEKKQLLLKDFCARLPYGVCVHIRYKEGEPCYGKLTPRDIQWFIDSNIENIKPYLRPMSSMTEEEKHNLLKFGGLHISESEEVIDISCLGFERHCEVQDYLNAHHFDYRGLIEKGLALEAKEGMYEI